MIGNQWRGEGMFLQTSLGGRLVQWLLLLLGIPIGVAANFCFQWLWTVLRWSADRIDIAGVWGERIHSGHERQCSVGKISYDIWRTRWTFDGTNYHDDGRPFCHWRTISSYLDRHNKVFYYIFLNTQEEEAHAGYTGFGIVHLHKVEKKWVPVRGAFAAGNPGESFRSHSMVRLESVPENRDQARELFRQKLGLPNPPGSSTDQGA
uniref:Uncharacterized protein n=1 Tax=Mycobacterium sp. (strain JLS) TaxID=164757 RepID=A0A5Q5CFG4_MYCSJ